MQVASPQVSGASAAASPVFDPSPDLQPEIAAAIATTAAKTPMRAHIGRDGNMRAAARRPTA